ncbi:hypothetical protein FB451DRAFT_1486455 [Mycena latifolia]|nr:hypothetical protein FB451DRAFT_1486455 [Mycena latifolia]
MEELASLRGAVARFQNEAHASAIKLQPHALGTSALSEWAAHLEAETARLCAELGVLCSPRSPLPPPRPRPRPPPPQKEAGAQWQS